MNIIEGEGGLTPGRVQEALATAATARLYNTFIHLDWNQASIDSNNVCAEDTKPGDYVQWSPDEVFYIHDWNVIIVPNVLDFYQILTAQKFSHFIDTNQPTAIIYRTIKGWKYGIEGRSSHGSGHKFNSEGYYNALKEFEEKFNKKMPRYTHPKQTPELIEECFYDTLMEIRETIKENKKITEIAAEKIRKAKERLDALKREKKPDSPNTEKVYQLDIDPPNELKLQPGTEITLREMLAKSLNYINKLTNGSIIVSSADLYGSTSVNLVNKDIADGFYNAISNPKSRVLAAGGICEDGMGAIASGISTYGNHIGATSSYAAFIAPLEHIAARLHAIGQQANHELTGEPFKPFIIINAHAGPKTGEDGPTHADPQALQLFQENFPHGTMITLTPLEPQEIWPLLAYSLKLRPAIIAPFVTRPPEKIIDRKKLGLPDENEAIKGIYYIMKADLSSKQYNGTIVIQGNASGMIFVNEVMPEIKKLGLNLNVMYVASKELFDYLKNEEKEKLYPASLGWHAIGITDFTLPTLYYWVRSEQGLKYSLHPFANNKYLGSGKAESVLKEAGLDKESQLKRIKEYAQIIEKQAKSKSKEEICL